MLRRQNQTGVNLEPKCLAEVFRTQLQRVHRFIEERQISCLVVQHASLLDDPQRFTATINDFFDDELDTQAMASVVDLTLYRERARKH